MNYVRPLVDADWPQIAPICKAAGFTGIPNFAFDANPESCAFLGVFEDDALRAFGVVTLSPELDGAWYCDCGQCALAPPDTRESHAYCIATHPTHRRQGHASTVMLALRTHAVMQGCHEMRLEADNPPAVALYESLGFDAYSREGSEITYLALAFEDNPPTHTQEDSDAL